MTLYLRIQRKDRKCGQVAFSSGTRGELSMLRHLSATDPGKLIFLPSRYMAVM
jgi:hypothetical protein